MQLTCKHQLQKIKQAEAHLSFYCFDDILTCPLGHMVAILPVNVLIYRNVITVYNILCCSAMLGTKLAEKWIPRMLKDQLNSQTFIHQKPLIYSI